MTCETCGREFTARRNDARYCSRACRQKAYRDRHAPVLARRFRLTDELGQYLSAAEFRELQKLVARIQTKIDNNTTQSR
jgi:hypothetical protein